MSSPQLIGPAPRTTEEAEPSRWRRRVVPDDILREASGRLGAISLIGAGLWVVAPLMGHFFGEMSRTHPKSLHLWHADAVALGSVIVSLALFFYSRLPDRNPRVVLDLGLAYMVLTAFALGQMFHSEDFSGHSTEPMISWIGVVILMFAAIVPATPGKMLVASLVSASMNPLGMLIARARGTWHFEPATRALVMHYPDYALALVAVAISHVVTKLGQQVTRARELGSYRLGELLGRGGMGEVYRATHRMLARPAAIKLIRPETMGKATGESAQVAMARFRREAETAASLRSPHTVELYDFGVANDKTMYFVMELLDGMDLETLVRTKGPVPAARAIFLLRQVCDSLAEAHARGLVHRDIKPANIHVGRLGLQHDFVKVLDFGLVKSVAGAGGGQSLETAAGSTLGTPAYLAPEMAVGAPVDARADIYALGCVAYFLLTGQLVFDGKTAVAVIAKHLHEAPVPPSRRTELPVPEALDRAVLACLMKKPEDRPQTVAALADMLAAVPVDEPWGEEQARRWWQVNRPA